MMDYAEQGGSWVSWTVANDYTGVMNGDPYHIIVSTAYAFGAQDFDAKTALLSMLRGATEPTTQGHVERPGLAATSASGMSPGPARTRSSTPAPTSPSRSWPAGWETVPPTRLSPSVPSTGRTCTTRRPGTC